MSRIVASLAALTLLLGGSSGAQASILYDNLSAGSSGSDGIATDSPGVGPLGDSFSTGASAASLTDVKALLAISGTPVGSISVDLYSESLTHLGPGILLAPIGTLTDTDLSATFAVKDFALGSPIALAANTRYWIVLSSGDDSSAIWSFSSDTSGTGVANEYLYNNNGGAPQVFANNTGGEPYQMQINAEVAAAPEPSSMLLLGSGLLATVGMVLVSLGQRKASDLTPAS